MVMIFLFGVGLGIFAGAIITHLVCFTNKESEENERIDALIERQEIIIQAQAETIKRLKGGKK